MNSSPQTTEISIRVSKPLFLQSIFQQHICCNLHKKVRYNLFIARNIAWQKQKAIETKQVN